MGALIGLLFALGVLSILAAWERPREQAGLSLTGRLRHWLDRHGSLKMSVAAFIALSIGSALGVAVLTAAIIRVPLVSIVFGFAAATIPATLVRGRYRRIQNEYRNAWPDAIDNLASAIRAGLSLGEAIGQLGERGPEPLRPHCAAFARDYERTGRFDESLDLLKARLADPVGDRVIEALRLARQVGGGDLGRMLRTLSSYVREEQRTRGEMESRQSWAVNGARMAVAAPWLVLLSVAFQPDVMARYATGIGPYVLLGAAAACLVAYRMMMAIGRLPTEQRILA